MKKGGPARTARNAFSNLPHLNSVSQTVPQVPISRVRGVWVFVFTFIVATLFVAYVDRQIALRQIGRHQP